MFSDCSGDCDDCLIHYTGGCLAGHGDDDFEPVTKESVHHVVKMMEKYRDPQDKINDFVRKINEKFPTLNILE